MSKWKEVKLDELAEVKGGKRLPKGKLLTTFKTNHPYIRITDFDGFKINLNNIQYVENNVQSSIARYIVNSGDIILSNVGTLGLVAIVPPELDNANLTENCVKILLKKDEIDNKFLYYQLISPDMQDLIVGLDVGSTQPKLPMYNIKNMDISLPPLKEQKAIAEVLSSLDNKIDFLHRQNKTLEELASSLFRQWFIEEAKDEWEEKPLSEIANFLNGLACQKFPPKNDVDKLPVLKIKDLKAGISDSSDWATTDIKPEYIIESGDVIFAWSASLIVKIWDGEKCILNQHLFKVTSDDYPKWFYYQWCKYHLDRFIAIAQAHATTMGHIKRKDLDNAMCFVPNEDEMKVMDKQMVPLMQKMENNSKQIKTLENMRDTLLPKLMSGEVRVKLDGEKT